MFFGNISSDHSCSGDIYHLDFSLGCPAYFDLFVRCTTQSSFISSAASQAGVAAVGEEAKDNHYLETVNNYGSDFISLVCESLNVWSAFALSATLVIVQLLKMVCPESRRQYLSVTVMPEWFSGTMLCIQRLKLSFAVLSSSSCL